MSLRAFTPDSGRQSPFKRQNSTASARATTPTPTSPTKPSPLSPVKSGSLSPEKASPFVRRPSQISETSERATSPFARPNSGLNIPTSPSRQISNASSFDATPPASPRAASITPAPKSPSPSPAPYDGTPQDSPYPKFPTLRKLSSSTTQRPSTASSTTSTIKPPSFTPQKQPPITTTPKLNNATANSGYNHIPAPLLRSMRESFEVLDASNTGSLASTAVAEMLEQLGLPNSQADLRTFFPSNAPSQLNLARYLDTLSGPLADLSSPEELAAAFSAFDVDDSGQIDVGELRRAVLETPTENGERLGEREVEGILSEFGGRRAFGGKGGLGKGEVFRWREFLGAVGVGGEGQSNAVMA